VLAGVLAVAIALWLARRAAAPEAHEFTGSTMGSTYRVLVAHALTDEQAEVVRSTVAERVARVEALMSTYDTASELSRFNRAASTEPVRVSEELLEIVELARQVSERSGGALDITVGPLVEAWGFGAGNDPSGPTRVPADSAIEALRTRVGFALLDVDRAAGTLRKAAPDVAIDVSALASGYAAELVARDLSGLGWTDFLVDVGGELQASGSAPGGREWRVGIEWPADDLGALWGTVELTNEGIATSGDYRDFWELDGARYAHIIDPRSGRPLPLRGMSATVVHERAALADAWATALTVLGPEEGLEVARREGLAALFLERVGAAVEARAAPAMGDRVEVREEPR